MLLNYPLLRRNWRRLLAGKVTDFRSLAVEERILCPRETVTSPKAIYFDGALDRIEKLSPWRDWDLERKLWEGGQGTHGESVAYDLENVDLVQSYLYRGADKMCVGLQEQNLLLSHRPKLHKISKASLVSSWAGGQFFGTLLVDDFPLELIDEGISPSISVHRPQSPHELEYRDMLDLTKASRTEVAHIDRLTLYEDFAQNSFKANRYRTLRSKLKSQFPGNPSPTGVYIRRGNQGEPRQLENEPAIEQLLLSHGFVVVDPATMSAREIAEKSLGAKIVAGTEGSQLSHGIFSAADNASFLVLQPPWRFSMSYKEFADCLDMPFAFLVGDSSEMGYTIRPDELQDMVEQLT